MSLQSLVIPLGAMAWSHSPAARSRRHPDFRSDQAADATGAGDTVIATFTPSPPEPAPKTLPTW